MEGGNFKKLSSPESARVCSGLSAPHSHNIQFTAANRITFSLYTQVNPTPEEQTRKKKNVDDGKAVYVVDTSPELRVTHPDGVWFY